MKEYSEQDASEMILKFVERRYTKRKQKERHLQKLVGNRKKKTLLYRLDLMLEYSSVRKYLRFINAEVFIVFLCFIGAVVYFLTAFISKSIFIGLFAMLAVCILFLIILYALSGVYYNKLEKNIMTFLNLIENFSKSEDDIVQIFRKTMMYIAEPFASLLREFCADAENLGDTNQAFENMIVKIEHDKCRELLRNLEVCSRFETNYEDIVNDCRSSMIDYLSIKAERKAIISNGRIEVIILLAGAAIIIALFAKITTGIWILMTESFIGNIIVIYCCIVVVICIVVMLMFDKKAGG